MHLHQIEAGDILDDHAARLGERAVRVRRVQADTEVAQRPVAVAARAGSIGGEHPADGDAVAQRRVERQHLAMGGERAIEVAERHPRLDGDCHILREIVEEAVEPPQADGEIVAARGEAERLLRPAPPRHDRRARLIRHAQERGDFLRRTRHGDDMGRLCADRESRRPLARPRVFPADDPFNRRRELIEIDERFRCHASNT